MLTILYYWQIVRKIYKVCLILFKWCEKWRLSINGEKTETMHIRTKNKPRSQYPLFFGVNYGTPEFLIPSNNCICLMYTNEYKYLGIVINEFLDFEVAAKHLSIKASKALGSLLSKFYHNNGMPLKTYKKLYEACIRKIMDYGAGTWGFGEFSCMEKIQNRAMRCFLGVHKYPPLFALQGEMAFIPTTTSRKLEILRLWNRILRLPNERLPKKLFHIMYQNNSKWCLSLKSILTEINKPELYTSKACAMIWRSRGQFQINNNLKFLEDISTKPKLRTYCKIKNSYQTEPYIVKCFSRNKRSVFAQLRIGILPIMIETGRYTNMAVESRFCNYCTLNKVEDEQHFLLECSNYTELRSTFYEKCRQENPTFDELNLEEKFIFIMNNDTMTNDCVNFVYDVFHKRKNA